MKMMNSIIVPAYNEEKRSLRFVPGLIDYVRRNIPGTEIILVDDGSKDNTSETIKKIISSKKATDFARVVGYKKNKGKGNAVSYGVKDAKGGKIIFIDADGSIKPNQIPGMIDKLDEYDVVVGSRIAKGASTETTFIRSIFSLGFNSIVSVLFQYSYRDNLCGFKGFRKEVAKQIFSNLIDKRWVFDVELFYKIKKKGYSLYFMPIEWHYVGGSRVNTFFDPLKWFLRLIRLRYKLTFG